jgi:hypothetical protein
MFVEQFKKKKTEKNQEIQILTTPTPARIVQLALHGGETADDLLVPQRPILENHHVHPLFDQFEFIRLSARELYDAWIGRVGGHEFVHVYIGRQCGTVECHLIATFD